MIDDSNVTAVERGGGAFGTSNSPMRGGASNSAMRGGVDFNGILLMFLHVYKYNNYR